jgi:hypothetical protein
LEIYISQNRYGYTHSDVLMSVSVTRSRFRVLPTDTDTDTIRVRRSVSVTVLRTVRVRSTVRVRVRVGESTFSACSRRSARSRTLLARLHLEARSGVLHDLRCELCGGALATESLQRAQGVGVTTRGARYTSVRYQRHLHYHGTGRVGSAEGTSSQWRTTPLINEAN